MTKAEFISAARCTSYVEGVLDSLSSAQNSHYLPRSVSVCLRQGVTGNQAVRILVKWLNDNPKYLDVEPPSTIVMAALHESFPCSGGH